MESPSSLQLNVSDHAIMFRLIEAFRNDETLQITLEGRVVNYQLEPKDSIAGRVTATAVVISATSLSIDEPPPILGTIPGVKPLTQTEQTMTDVLLAMLNDNGNQKVTMTASMLADLSKHFYELGQKDKLE